MSRATDGFSAMTSVFGTRDTLAEPSNGAFSGAWTVTRESHGGDTGGRAGRPPLPLHGRGQLARDAPRIPPAGVGAREPARGRVRRRREPHVELRPLAARDAPLAAA